MAMQNLYHRLCTLICSSPHLAINVSCLSYRDTENKKTVNKKTQIAVTCKNRGRRVAVSEERTEEVDMTGNKKKKLLCGGIEIGGVWPTSPSATIHGLAHIFPLCDCWN